MSKIRQIKNSVLSFNYQILVYGGFEMKKLDLLIVLLIWGLILSFSSCGVDGTDGKAYLRITVDPSSDAWYGYMEGFPSGWSLNTYYELDAGEHEAKYALCKYLNFDGSNHNWAVNSYNLTTRAVYGPDNIGSVDALIFYLNNDGIVFSNTFTFEVNEGTAGSIPFQDGISGQDTDYSLYLAWDPTYSVLSSNGVELEKAIFPGDHGSTILQFKDEYRTFILTIPENTTASNVEIDPVVRAVK